MLNMMFAAAAIATAEMTVPGPKGADRRHAQRCRRRFADGADPSWLGTDRPRREQSARGTASPYRLLAEALAKRGVSTLRADKRGMFGSKSAIADPDAVTLVDYAADAHSWADALHKRSHSRCVWLLGHSEGG